jgi:hypothetical protein
MAFAFVLLEARRRLDECATLMPLDGAEQRKTLRRLLRNLEATTSVWCTSEV